MRVLFAMLLAMTVSCGEDCRHASADPCDGCTKVSIGGSMTVACRCKDR